MEGFLNVHLANEQFMDRVQVLMRTKTVTNKDALRSSLRPDNNTEVSYCIRPIAYLESCFREKFGTPR